MSDLRIRPHDYQVADVEDILRHNGIAAVVAETGAGKTIIAAEAIRRSGAPTSLIIAPQGTLKSTWEATITGHIDTRPWSETYGEWITGLDPEARVRRIDGSATGKEAMDALEWKEPGYYLMTPQLFTRWNPQHLRPDFTVVDEAHQFGNRDGVGSKRFMKFAGSTGMRLAQSGTLAGPRFENLWPIMRFLYPDLDEPGQVADISSVRWVDKFCKTKFHPHAPGNRVVTGELVEGTVAAMVPCWRQHFKRRECCEFHPEGFLANLPEPVMIREVVQLTDGQKKAIKQAQRDYLAHLDIATEEWKALPLADRKKKALVMKLPIVRETRLSQMTLAMPSLVPRPSKADPDVQARDDDGFPLWDVIFEPDAESPKLDRLIEVFRRVEEPMVVATHSQKFAAIAVPRLNAAGIRAAGWWGDIPQAQRDATKLDLKEGRLDVVIGQTDAIGTGIDGLQDAAGVLVSMSKSRSLVNEIQLEGRLDRPGQMRVDGVLHVEIIAEGTTDEDIIDEQLERRFRLNKSLQKEVRRTRA